MALTTWKPFDGSTLLFSIDTWIFKLPLYLLFPQLMDPSRAALLLECVALAIAGFVLFYGAVLYFTKRHSGRIDWKALLPLIWLSGSGLYLANLLLNPNLRNVEIGLAFIIIVLIAKFYDVTTNIFKAQKWIIVGVLTALLTGFLIYDDPLFLFFLVAPLALFILFRLWFYAGERKKNLILLGLVVLALITYKLTEVFATAAGVKIFPQETKFVNFDNLLPHFLAGINSVMTIFNADFTGRLPFDLTTISKLLNFAFLAFVIQRVFANLKGFFRIRRAKQHEYIWPAFFAFLFVFIFTVYVISSISVDVNTHRYLVLLPFIGVLLLSLAWKTYSKSSKVILSTIIIIGTILNISTNISTLKDAGIAGPSEHSSSSLNDGANHVNLALVNALNKDGLSKGYAQYWDSHINTYLSKGTLNVAPVICNGTETAWFNWLVDDKLLKGNASLKNSFLIYNKADEGKMMCTVAVLNNQFGEPSRTIHVEQYDVFIYNYDIGTKITKERLSYSTE